MRDDRPTLHFLEGVFEGYSIEYKLNEVRALGEDAFARQQSLLGPTTRPGVDVQVASKAEQGEGEITISYSKVHKDAFFPLPHNHGYVTLCWEVEVEGEDGETLVEETCITIEYPTDIGLPLPGLWGTGDDDDNHDDDDH